MTIDISTPLTLQGFTLKNRLMKGAMSEALATADGIVTAPLLRLYDTWG